MINSTSWLWLAIGSAAALIVYVRHFQPRRANSRQIQKFASDRHWQFLLTDSIGLYDRLHRLAILRQGHQRRLFSIVQGQCAFGRIVFVGLRYDLGFGIRKIERRWWVAAVQVSTSLPAWSASPINPGTQSDADYLNRFELTLPHRSTLHLLKESHVASALARAPADAHFEVIGPLVSIAIPADSEAADPDRMVDCVMRLAGVLTGHDDSEGMAEASASGQPWHG